jgi:hypothetical protein
MQAPVLEFADQHGCFMCERLWQEVITSPFRSARLWMKLSVLVKGAYEILTWYVLTDLNLLHDR